VTFARFNPALRNFAESSRCKSSTMNGQMPGRKSLYLQTHSGEMTR
jgi:hypothetical protein